MIHEDLRSIVIEVAEEEVAAGGGALWWLTPLKTDRAVVAVLCYVADLHQRWYQPILEELGRLRARNAHIFEQGPMWNRVFDDMLSNFSLEGLKNVFITPNPIIGH
ncbi:MAG TPA: hypothetical protein VHA52_08530 [Candidatus Babeliaceae bacterium]|nr:hypothetical protein [Candidatus Babeliaceae bacterium]